MTLKLQKAVTAGVLFLLVSASQVYGQGAKKGTPTSAGKSNNAVPASHKPDHDPPNCRRRRDPSPKPCPPNAPDTDPTDCGCGRGKGKG